MKTKTMALVLALAVATSSLAGCAALSGPTAAQETQTPQTTQPIRGEIEAVVGATGTVATAREARLVFDAGGTVEEVLVEIGTEVNAGQPLIRLRDDDLVEAVERAQASVATYRARLEQTQAPPTDAQMAGVEAGLASAKASVDSAQAGIDALYAGATSFDLESAKLSVDSARNSLWSAQANRDAVKGSRAASGAQGDQAEAQVLIAEVAVQQALVAQEKALADPEDHEVAAVEAQLHAAQAQLDSAQAQLDQLREQPYAEDVAVVAAQLAEAELTLAHAHQALDDAVLTAPFAGTILDVSVNEGEWVSPGAPVVHMADTEALTLEVLLDEVDIAQVALGQPVNISLDALPAATVPGTVTRIAPSSTDTSRGVAFEVEVSFQRGDHPVRLGMTSQVDIVVQRAENALLVPNRAVHADREAGTYWVYVLSGAGREDREVKIGLRDDSHSQILSGLSGDERLLLQVVDTAGDEEEERPRFFPPRPHAGM